MENGILNIATDWNMIYATLFAGILTALATFAAVLYTNKKTAERYEKDKDYQNKRDNLVIIKPTVKFSGLINIIEELICYNIRDRVLLISSEKDGFDFYDDDNKLYTENHRLLCIKNEDKHNINFITIDMYSRLKTDSNAIIDDKYSNFIKLLRPNEEIIFRVHSTEQRSKLWEELDKNKQVELFFNCKINYLTLANEQICYEYEAQIINIPETRIIDGQEKITNNAKIITIKDEYKILPKIILNKDEKASVFRNLQDQTNVADRVNYIHKKIGTAQAQGAISQFGNVFSNLAQQNTVSPPKIEDGNQNET